MKITKTYASFAAVAAALALIAAACGGGSTSGTGSPASSSPTSAETVSASTVDGIGDVLVDAQGEALYAADVETGGMVLCVASCTTIWDPLTVSGDGTPTAADGIAADLGVVTRPDGTRQVTFDGSPLYRFVEDPSPGTVTGNGFADSFDGRTFTWHVATPTGVSTSSANSTPSTDGYGS
jgi:predicted lipoprotein with Yx(FWY)xxD motif